MSIANETTALLVNAVVKEEKSNAVIDIVDDNNKRVIATPRLSRTLFRMALCFVSSTLVSGILQSFPELSSLLVAEGFFAEGCGDAPVGLCAQQNETLQQVYYVAVGLSVAGTLLVGQLYDSFGSRFCGVVGGIGSLVALYLMFLSLTYHVDALLWLALPLSYSFGAMASYLSLGFMWHTEYQILAVSLGPASLTLSQLAMLVVDWLCRSLGLELRFAVCVLMAGVFVGTVLAAAAGPSGTECREQGERVLGTPVPVPKFRPLHMARDALDIMRQRKGITVLSILVCITPYLLLNYWVGSFYSFAVASHGVAQAQTLSRYFSLIVTLAAVVMSLATGWLVDRVGLRVCLVILAVASVLVCVLLMLPSVPAQYVTMIVGATFVAMFSNMTFKLATQFAPPELVGNWSGLIFAVCGIVQIGCNFALPYIAQRLAIPGLWQFQAFYLTFGGMTVLAIAAFLYFTTRGMPSIPQCRTTGKPLFSNSNSNISNFL